MFLAALGALSVLAGGTAAVVGFGIGSLLTPFLLTRYPPILAIGAVALPHVAATLLRFLQHRPATDRRVLLAFGAPSAVGGLIGAWAQSAFSDVALFAALGLLLIATAIANLTNNFGGAKARTPIAIVLGGLSGLFGGLVGNQGGLRAAGLLAFDLPPRAYIATGTAVGLLIDAARTPVYLARAGHDLLPLAAVIAVATAGCLTGTLLGEKVFFGLPPERYRNVVGVAVGILGVWLLIQR